MKLNKMETVEEILNEIVEKTEMDIRAVVYFPVSKEIQQVFKKDYEEKFAMAKAIKKSLEWFEWMRFEDKVKARKEIFNILLDEKKSIL